MKYLYLFILFTICLYKAQAQIVAYNNAAQTDFFNLGGYSFTQALHPNGVQANPYLVAGPTPQNDFRYEVSAVGGITNRLISISTTNSNTSISIKFLGNNVRKFGGSVRSINNSLNLTNDIISLTAITNLGATVIQSGSQSGPFVGFNVTGNENEYIVSITATFSNPPSPAAFITINNITLGDNSPQNVALNFDGVNDYVDVSSSVGNFNYNEPFTVTCWVRPAALQPSLANPDNAIIEKWDQTGPYPFVIRYLNQTAGADAGKVRVQRFDGINAPSITSIPINDGKWHHIAFTSTGSGGQLNLYIDGVRQGAGTLDNTTQTTTNSSPLYFGRRGLGASGTNYFKGDIDEVRIWGFAKPQNVIQSEMYCKSINSALAAYNFNSGVPNTNNDFIITIPSAVNSGDFGALFGFDKNGDASNFVAGQVIYVNSNNGSLITQDGSSWEKGYYFPYYALSLSDLQPGLACYDLVEVYIKKGKYIDLGGPDNFYNVVAPKIYGGFAGTEKNINQRNKTLIHTTNESILTADYFTSLDTPYNFSINREDNRDYIFKIQNKNDIFIDGITFSGAKVNAINTDNSNNIKIKECIIKDNGGSVDGNTSPVYANNSTFTIENAKIFGNIGNASSGVVTVNGSSSAKSFTLNNSLIYGNNAANRGAIVNWGSFGTVNLNINNSTIAGNTKNGLFNFTSGTGIVNAILKNSIIRNNELGTTGGNITATYSMITGINTGTGMLNSDLVGPQFISPISFSMAPTEAGDYHLNYDSPCFNTGTDVGVSPLDLDGNSRTQGGKTDMGAYEIIINSNEIISIANGNWESNTTWNLQRVPLATDKVIMNGHTVTVTTNAAKAKNLEQKPASDLKFNAGGSLQLHQ